MRTAVQTALAALANFVRTTTLQDVVRVLQALPRALVVAGPMALLKAAFVALIIVLLVVVGPHVLMGKLSELILEHIIGWPLLMLFGILVTAGIWIWDAVYEVFVIVDPKSM